MSEGLICVAEGNQKNKLKKRNSYLQSVAS